MQSITLSGGWQLKQVGEAQCYHAQVPGGVHTDLIAAGVIPDPFFADCEYDVMWVAEKDWQYLCTFMVPSDLLEEDRSSWSVMGWIPWARLS
jgi:beta-mannosidase